MDKTNKQTEITKCISCVRYSVIKKTYKENDKRQKKKNRNIPTPKCNYTLSSVIQINQ